MIDPVDGPIIHEAHKSRDAFELVQRFALKALRKHLLLDFLESFVDFVRIFNVATVEASVHPAQEPVQVVVIPNLELQQFRVNIFIINDLGSLNFLTGAIRRLAGLIRARLFRTRLAGARLCTAPFLALTIREIRLACGVLVSVTITFAINFHHHDIFTIRVA